MKKAELLKAAGQKYRELICDYFMEPDSEFRPCDGCPYYYGACVLIDKIEDINSELVKRFK